MRKGGEAETGAMSAGPDAWGASAADNASQAADSPAADTDLTDSGTGARKGKTKSPVITASGVVVEEGLEEDPLHEVNTYLAFEQFEQAEEIARNAIAAQPGNPEFYIKLLEIFYTSGNTGAYEEAARTLHELTGGKGEHWGKATAMWSEISPERALFAEAQAEADEDGASADTDDKLPDVTDVTPVGLAVDSATAKASQSAEHVAAEEALLDIDLAAAKKEGDIATAPEPDEALAADQIATAPERAAAVDADIDLDLSEFDTVSKPLAAPDGGANDDTDLDLPALDDAHSVNTDDTPAAEDRPEDTGAADAGKAAGATQPAADKDEELETVRIPRADQPPEQSLEDQMATQLDLARAYIEIGDKQSARGILDEVMARGNAEQKQQAEALSSQI